MPVSPVPPGSPTVSAYLIVPGVPKLIEFLETVFDATLLNATRDGEGNIGHAEVKIGDSTVMMGEASDKWPAMPAGLHIYVPDIDAVYRKAMEFGAKSVMEPVTQFYGDRSAGVVDPNGNTWWIATHVEDVSDEEIQRRAAEFGRKAG